MIKYFRKFQKKTFIALTLAFVFYAFEFYLRIAPSSLIPSLMPKFHIDASGIGILASSFYFGYCLGQIPGGILLDYFSTRTVLIAAVLFSALSAFIFAGTHILFLGVLSRFLGGIASSVSFIIILFIARHYVNEYYFSIIAGLAVSFGTLMASFTQTLALNMFANLNTKTVFLGLGEVGVILAVVSYFVIDSNSPSQDQDKK